jgi:methionyl-tRNA synthetase
MAAGLPLPKKIIAHGHWTMNKEKMSKSKGNVVDPNKLIDDFGVDFVRYFLLRYGGIGTDGDFAEEILVDSVTAELANTFGNLLGRCTSAALNQSGRWPEFSKPTEQEVEMLEKLKTLPSMSRINSLRLFF